MGRIKAPQIIIINKKTTNYNTMKFTLALIAATGSALKLKQDATTGPATTDAPPTTEDYNCLEQATMHVVAGLDTDGDWKVNRDEFQIIIDNAGFDADQLAGIEEFFAANESADVMAAMQGFTDLLAGQGVPEEMWCDFLFGVGDELHGIPPPGESQWDEAGCQYGDAKCVFDQLFHALDDNYDGSLDQVEVDDVVSGLVALDMLSEEDAAEASAWFAEMTGDGDATKDEVEAFLIEEYLREAEEDAYHDLLDAYRIATNELGEWEDQAGMMGPMDGTMGPMDSTMGPMDGSMPPPPTGTAGPMDGSMPPPPSTTA